MSVEVAVTVPYNPGRAEVRMPFASGNRAWLRVAVETRQPEWVRDRRHWLIPRAAARRVFDAATADGRSATLTHVFKPDTEKCTEQCRTARLDTVDSCTCICGGEYHGQSLPGWRQAGAHLLVRPGGDGFITRTVSNGIKRAPGAG